MVKRTSNFGEDLNEVLVIRTGNLEKKIDLTPINKIVEGLKYILDHRESLSDRRHIDYYTNVFNEVKKLDKDQLLILSDRYFGLISNYADMYQRAWDNPDKLRKEKEDYELLNNLVNKSLKKTPEQ